MRLLIVDDEPDVARLFEQRLRRELKDGALELRFARSAEEVFPMMDEEPMGGVIILSDINMPGMNGLELLAKLRGGGATMPIWMISAYENEHYQSEAQRLGATGFIPKPLDFEELKRVIGLQAGQGAAE
jgi:DNA-binding NtrC family response regulator